jgi:hypothetical protein
MVTPHCLLHPPLFDTFFPESSTSPLMTFCPFLDLNFPMYLFCWGNHWGNLRDMSERLVTGTWVSCQGFNTRKTSLLPATVGSLEEVGLASSPLSYLLCRNSWLLLISVYHTSPIHQLLSSLSTVFPEPCREWQRCPICDWAFSRHSFPALSW